MANTTISSTKISSLAPTTVILGNTIVPIVSNIAGSLTTLRSNVEQIRNFILGNLSTSDLANISVEVATLISNAAVQSGNLAQLYANAAAQSGILADLSANAVAQTLQISTLQSNLNSTNAAMRAYVDFAVASNVADILNDTVFTGNVSLANLTISDITGTTSLYATNADGNITLVPSGTGVIDVSGAKISNLSDPTSAADAVTLGYLNTALSSSVVNLISDDTEVTVTDDGVSPGEITQTVDGTLMVRTTANGVEIITGVEITGNIIPSIDSQYSLGSLNNQWKDLWISNSSIYIGGAEVTVLDNEFIVNSFNLTANIIQLQSDAANLTANTIAQETFLDGLQSITTSQAASIAALDANAAIQSGEIAAAEANIVIANTAMKGYVDNQVSSLTANAAVQAGEIISTQANIVIANLAMKGYVDGQVSSLTSNAAVQAGAISSLEANAAVQAGAIAALDANAAVQAGAINSLTANAAAQAGAISSLTANAAAQAGAIAALDANAAVQAGLIAALSSGSSVSISAAEANIVLANTAMKGYVDGQVSSLTANAAAQAGAIAALDANAAVQAGAINSLTANAAVQAGAISSLTANAAAQAGAISSLEANAAVQAGAIAALDANAAVQAGAINSLTANAAVQAGAISAIVSYSNTLVASYLPVYSGNAAVNALTVNNVINGNSNGVGNIGELSKKFDTVFAKATSAQYADVAENYLADAEYEPGTVVVFGGENEITVSNIDHDHRIAGVISTQPAHIMNTSLQNGLPVALIGRVPCKVVGQITKGDLLVQSQIFGVATKLTNWIPGCVIGKALESYNSSEVGLIEVTVGRI